ncbi:MAG: RNA-binding protein [Deltaproteobacteria bacterium CG_4_8_14_3_um_filter_43_13]|nr:MAG: RNA-binding protein [Deltaproteobacteria bacterium CG2_30_43_15]PIX24481.1 MAG: RNA-binding protein [Deltaproteobacteria bacterium CG_4_8_14_3_um_filter_43_13]PIZ18807.1 MAG: RNA-binding protein [Deltaproteobacteria bacterium CG_4_10_14_0_8_um_filter_43_12]HCX90215.1 RNA-binding protein [Deltaproteobacteria bacterium]
MCEANAYLERDGKEELILESVDIIEPEDGKVFIRNIFGEQKVLNSRIKKISLIDHKILLEEIG